MKRLVFVLALLGLCLPYVAGCHTVQGAGEDMQRAGEKSQHAIAPEDQ